jgi:hypothetical protein
MATYPIADFSQEVINNSSLHDIKYDISQKKNLWEELNTNFMGKNNITYKEVAETFRDKVKETIEAHENQWVKSGIYGYYIYESDAPKMKRDEKDENGGKIYIYDDCRGKAMPYNQQHTMGRTLLMMWKANAPDKEEYKNKVIRMAEYLKRDLPPEKDYYIWHYWKDDPWWLKYSQPERGDNTPKNNPDDISHGWIVVDFARLCYENNIVFNLEDMKKFARTFTKGAFVKPFDIYLHIDHSNVATKERKLDDSERFLSGFWIPMSKFDRNIYQVALDIYKSKLFPDRVTIGRSLELLGIANLLNYKSNAFSKGFLQYQGDGGWWQSGFNCFDLNNVSGRMVAIDLDSNGYQDDIAVFYDYGNSTASIWGFYNTGTRFEPSERYSNKGGFDLKAVGDRMVAIDLDRDGYLDDIAVFYDYGNSTASIWGFYNVGTGFVHSERYSNKGGFDLKSVGDRMVAIDLDSDGYQDDIAVFYDYGNELTSIWGFDNIGSGFYPSQYWTFYSYEGGYNLNYLSNRMISGDFNHDNIIDIATFYNNPGTKIATIHVFFNYLFD